ncbi:hypothetical protein SAMN04489835_0277 [Mycolicibacterium rutilum]|uniref:Uncharacterized protein n=1 Tax=Mycolicibacterium rutilum TaxID=370526 RepID=A0A1H6IGE1_MYCRU|nr:hypothetical protein [Mycolicibacterium rutilum]SEH47855.1 hypothetical protein SAMN04489835_0277 [Mycolicibacterium rutilum]
MVRTGARAAALQSLMTRAGFRPVAVAPAAPRPDVLPNDAYQQVSEVFEALGGRAPMPALRPGAWDLVFADGLVVELDEELHFNRYRAQTLGFPWATVLPWRDAYLDYCGDYEQECLAAGKWGKRWTTTSCESMVGTPSAPGVLAGSGSPRWKQRALYDAVKDIAAMHSSALRLCRLAIWDTVGDIRLHDAFAGSALDLQQLADFVAQRTI